MKRSAQRSHLQSEDWLTRGSFVSGLSLAFDRPQVRAKNTLMQLIT
jgi:hypothetical protein